MYVRVQSTRKGGRTSRAARNQFWETPTCLIVNSELSVEEFSSKGHAAGLFCIEPCLAHFSSNFVMRAKKVLACLKCKTLLVTFSTILARFLLLGISKKKKMKAPLVLGERRGKQSWENNNSSCSASQQGIAAAFDVSRVFSSLVK